MPFIRMLANCKMPHQIKTLTASIKHFSTELYKKISCFYLFYLKKQRYTIHNMAK